MSIPTVYLSTQTILKNKDTIIVTRSAVQRRRWRRLPHSSWWSYGVKHFINLYSDILFTLPRGTFLYSQHGAEMLPVQAYVRLSNHHAGKVANLVKSCSGILCTWSGKLVLHFRGLLQKTEIHRTWECSENAPNLRIHFTGNLKL